ncbi:hypothetical protein [Rhodococcus koreensis]|uniref:hypothetical protein n=1 Tax=Rhodococcus koreensis TaxID=99653 RepID=UPI0036D973AA
MTAPSPATAAQIADKLRYASTLVTIGIDPDDPTGVVADMVQIPGRSICLAYQANILRDMAKALDEAHKQRPC